MDCCLAHVLTRLDELDLVEDTMLVVTTDHGEELDEHGCWFDHHGLYDTNTRIPLIVRCPGLIPEGRRVNGLTTSLDVVPTILDFAGIETEPLDGVSLRPLIEMGDGFAPRGTCDAIHMTENTWMKKRAVRTASWKLIQALEPDPHGFPEVELYNLAEDPQEQRDLAQAMPEKADELLSAIAEHVRRRTAKTGLPDPLPLQPVPLKRVGKLQDSDPRKAEPQATGERSVRPGTNVGDEKLRDGDFIGYVRDDDGPQSGGA